MGKTPHSAGPGGAATVGEVLVWGAALLRAAGVEGASLDAAVLLGRILGKDRAGLSLAEGERLEEAARGRFCGFLKRRLAGECVAWIVGYKEFWGLAFAVGPAALVPRPETETLVEAALAALDARGEGTAFLDLCTGCGAVGISIKHERPRTAVYASDLSPAALELARENSTRLLGPGAAVFVQGDLLEPFSRRFDLIASNPPYIPRPVLEALPLEVRREPVLALDGGEEGLDLIRRIVAAAGERLNPGGALFLEADPGQMAAIRRLLVQGGYRNIRTYGDLSGRERVIAGEHGM